MPVTIQLRRDTAANWTTNNPTLALGEVGFETDTLAFKMGTGAAAWNSLGYRTLGGDFASLLTTAFAADTEPSAPAAGKMLFYSKNVANRMMPKFIGPSGLDSILQPAMFANGMDLITPASSTAFTVIGTATFAPTGTVSHPLLAAGSLRLSTRRAIVTSAATAASASELRLGTTRCWRGDAAGLGGFTLIMRFGASSAVSGQRVACGLLSVTTAIAATQSPSALTNCLLVANDAADANLSIMHNDAAGTCTIVPLGASFPVPSSANNAIYDVTFFARPNDTDIGWRVVRLDSAAVASGTIVTADIPTSTTFLCPHMYINNNGVATAVILDFFRYYLESDF